MRSSVLGVLFLISPLDVVVVADKPNHEEPLTLKPDQTIQVKQFLFSGNQAIPLSQLQRLTTPYLNRALSQTDFNNIKQRIKMFYAAKGFPQAEVMIQASQTQGTVMIMITEGKKEPVTK